jgi:hypothetical protein
MDLNRISRKGDKPCACGEDTGPGPECKAGKFRESFIAPVVIGAIADDGQLPMMVNASDNISHAAWRPTNMNKTCGRLKPHFLNK